MKHQPDAHGRAVLIGKDGLQKQRVVIARVAVAAEHGVSQAVDHRYAVYQLVALHHMGWCPTTRSAPMSTAWAATVFCWEVGSRSYSVPACMLCTISWQPTSRRASICARRFFLRAGGQAERRTREADHHAVMRPHRYMVRVKIGHARVRQRGLGIRVAFRTIVQGVVVAQSRQFHPAHGKMVAKSAGPLKLKVFFTRSGVRRSERPPD